MKSLAVCLIGLLASASTALAEKPTVAACGWVGGGRGAGVVV